MYIVDLTSGKAINEFNDKLQQQLQSLVFEIDKNDTEKIKKIFLYPSAFFKKIMLFIPAVAGYLFHFPLYYLIDVFIKNKASDHYDSIMVGILFFFIRFMYWLLHWLRIFITQ